MSADETPYPYTPEQEAWLRDLETTDAPQTTAMLHRLDPEIDGNGTPADAQPGGFCCLGRACIVLGVPSQRGAKGVLYRDALASLAPQEVALLKLRDSVGQFALRSGDVFTSLADMNDSGKTFKEIAAYIRAHPRNVFTGRCN